MDSIRQKALTEVAAIEGILCFGAKSLEARYPSISLLLDHGVIWVNATRPWPSGKHVRNEDSGGSVISTANPPEGRPASDEGFIDNALMLPGDKGRNATEGVKDEQADEWTERRQNNTFHDTGRFIRLHTGFILL